MSELHLNHYDDETFFTVDVYDAEATNALKELGATHIRDNLYRLPVNQVVDFLARHFKLDDAGHRHVSEAQKKARSENLALARARRWAKTAK
jgi:hypothetical protein